VLSSRKEKNYFSSSELACHQTQLGYRSDSINPICNPIVTPNQSVSVNLPNAEIKPANTNLPNAEIQAVNDMGKTRRTTALSRRRFQRLEKLGR